MTFPYRTAMDDEIRAAMRWDLFRKKSIEHLLSDEEDHSTGLLMSEIAVHGHRDVVEAWQKMRDQGVVIVTLDVHGTLISRYDEDDLDLIQQFRWFVSLPAKRAGVFIIMNSAGPFRELNATARSLWLKGYPALGEIGHLFKTDMLQPTPPYQVGVVTRELKAAFNDIRGWLDDDVLDSVPGTFLEEKRVIVSVNIQGVNADEQKSLKQKLENRLGKYGVPLRVDQSDATLDVCHREVNKASSLFEVIGKLGVNGGKIVAVGDSMNDLDMLQAASPGLLGCPSNSHSRVKDFVQERGGVVAKHPYLAGTLDVLRQILNRY